MSERKLKVDTELSRFNLSEAFMRRVLTTITIAAASVALASPASADWSYTRWGMTPAQVVRASGGTARLADVAPAPGQTYIIKATGTVQSGGLQFASDFRFAADRLVSVTLYLRQGTCVSAMAALEEKYGPRRRGMMGEYNWTSASENVRVELEMGSSCIVSYRPRVGSNASNL